MAGYDDNSQADLQFTADLQDNVSPTADQIEARLKKLGASKHEIKMFLTAYDQATPRIKQVQEQMGRMPKNHMINIQTNADQAHQKLHKLRELAQAPITVTIHVKDNIDEYINKYRMKMSHLEYEMKNSLRNMPITGALLGAGATATNMLSSPFQALTGLPAVGVGLGAAGGLGAMGAFFAKSFQQNSQQEQNMAQLTQLLRSPTAATNEYRNVVQFATHTPFNMPDVLASDIRLRAIGVNPNNRILGNPAAGNLAAGAQVPLTQAQGAISAASLGYFEQLNTITGRNIKQSDFQYGGRYTGKTYEQAIQDVLRQYTGALQTQTQTFKGLMTNIQDVISQRFIMPVGQPLFQQARSLESSAAGKLGSNSFQLSLSREVDKLQQGLIKVFDLVRQGTGYFKRSLEDPLKSITSSVAQVGMAFGKTFGGATLTGVKYLSEALATIVQPLAAIAAKFPQVAEVAGLIKALHMFGISTSTGTKDFFGGLAHLDIGRALTGIKEFTSLIGKIGLYFTVKSFLDMKNANDQLANSFKGLGTAGNDSMNQLKANFDEMILKANELGKSVPQLKQYGAIIGEAVGANQRVDPRGNRLAQIETYGALDTARLSYGLDMKGAATANLSATWAKAMQAGGQIYDQNKNPEKVMYDVHNQIYQAAEQLSKTLGISLNEAAKGAAVGLQQFHASLAKAQMIDPRSASLAYGLNKVLSQPGNMTSKDYAKFGGPADLVNALLTNAVAPGTDVLKAALHSRKGLDSYFTFRSNYPNAPGLRGRDPRVTGRLPSHTQDMIDMYGSYNRIERSNQLSQQDLVKQLGAGTVKQLGIQLPKFDNVFSSLHIPTLSTKQIETMNPKQSIEAMLQFQGALDRSSKALQDVNQQIEAGQNELSKYSIATEQAGAAMAGFQLKTEKQRWAIDSAQLAMQKFTLDTINPLQRALAAAGQAMADYQQKNVVPIQRAQEDWNQTMLRTSNHLEDISFKLGLAQFNMGKFSDGMLVGENALQDQIQSLTVYTAKLDMLKMMNMGLQADLTKTQFHEGFTSTVKPLMGFTLEREQQLAQERLQFKQDQYATTYGNQHWQMSRAARPLFQREEMGFGTRMQGILSARSIIDTGTLQTRDIQNLQYQEQLKSRLLQEAMYKAAVGERPLQDRQYSLNRSMYEVQRNVSLKSDAIAKSQLAIQEAQLPYQHKMEHMQNILTQKQAKIDANLARLYAKQGALTDAISQLHRGLGNLSDNFNRNIIGGPNTVIGHLGDIATALGVSNTALHTIETLLGGHGGGRGGGLGGSPSAYPKLTKGPGTIEGLWNTLSGSLNPLTWATTIGDYVSSKLHGGVLGTLGGGTAAALVALNAANAGSIVTSQILGRTLGKTKLPGSGWAREIVLPGAPLRRIFTPTNFARSRGGDLVGFTATQALLHGLLNLPNALTIPISAVVGDILGSKLGAQGAGKPFQFRTTRSVGKAVFDIGKDFGKNYIKGVSEAESHIRRVIRLTAGLPYELAKATGARTWKGVTTFWTELLEKEIPNKLKAIDKKIASAGKSNIVEQFKFMDIYAQHDDGPFGKAYNAIRNIGVELGNHGQKYEKNHAWVSKIHDKSVDIWNTLKGEKGSTDAFGRGLGRAYDISARLKSTLGAIGESKAFAVGGKILGKLGEAGIVAGAVLPFTPLGHGNLVNRVEDASRNIDPSGWLQGLAGLGKGIPGIGGILGAFSSIPSVTGLLDHRQRDAKRLQGAIGNQAGNLNSLASLLTRGAPVANNPAFALLGGGQAQQYGQDAQGALQKSESLLVEGIKTRNAKLIRESLGYYGIAKRDEQNFYVALNNIRGNARKDHITLTQQEITQLNTVQTQGFTDLISGPKGLKPYLDTISTALTSHWNNRGSQAAQAFQNEAQTHISGYNAIGSITGGALGKLKTAIDTWSKSMGLPLAGKGGSSGSIGSIISGTATSIISGTVGAISTAINFASGGVVDADKHQVGMDKGRIVRMVEEGHPEVVIPLAPHRRERAKSLIDQTKGLIGYANGGMVKPNTLRHAKRGKNIAHHLSKYATGGYVFPLPGFTLGQIDQGVDADAAPGTPILALGDSKLVNVLQNWYAGQPFLDFQLQNGPDANKFWYVAEQITPVTERIGAMFKAGQAVGHFAPSGTGIEIGWAANAAGQTLTQATAPGQVASRHAGSGTTAGNDFNAFIRGLAHGKLVGGGPGGAGSVTTPIHLPGINKLAASLKDHGIVGHRFKGILAKAIKKWQHYLNNPAGGTPAASQGPAHPGNAQQKAIVAAAAKRWGIDPKFLWGVYGVETDFGANLSTSSTGAQGYFQFEPATAKAYGVNPYNFSSSAYGAAHLLSTGKAGGPLGMVKVFYGAPDPGYLSKVENYAKQYAGGMPRIPYDNFPALLHKDERVLSAAEHNMYKHDGNKSGDDRSTVIAEAFRKLDIKLHEISLRHESPLKKIAQASEASAAFLKEVRDISRETLLQQIAAQVKGTGPLSHRLDTLMKRDIVGTVHKGGTAGSAYGDPGSQVAAGISNEIGILSNLPTSHLERVAKHGKQHALKMDERKEAQLEKKLKHAHGKTAKKLREEIKKLKHKIDKESSFKEVVTGQHSLATEEEHQDQEKEQVSTDKKMVANIKNKIKHAHGKAKLALQKELKADEHTEAIDKKHLAATTKAINSDISKYTKNALHRGVSRTVIAEALHNVRKRDTQAGGLGGNLVTDSQLNKIPPIGEYRTPRSHKIAKGHHDTSKAHHTTAKGHHNTAKGHASDAKAATKTLNAHLKVAQNHLKTSQQHLKNSQGQLKTSQTHLKSAQTSSKTLQNHLKATQGHVKISQTHLKTAESHLKAIQAVHTVAKAATELQKTSQKTLDQHLKISQEHLKAAQQHLKTSQEHLKASSEISKTSKQAITVSERHHKEATGYRQKAEKNADVHAAHFAKMVDHLSRISTKIDKLDPNVQNNITIQVDAADSSKSKITAGKGSIKTR